MAASRLAAAGVILLTVQGGKGEDVESELENSFPRPKSKCPMLCSDRIDVAGF